jgi:archaellum component FlaF (FlaF/FlaG flagellin family)
MAAIITNKFRVNAAERFIDDLTNTSTYYIGIGRPEEWDVETSPDAPYDNHHSTLRSVWQSMFGMKKIGGEDITYAIPRYIWRSGEAYSAYDDRDENLEQRQYFVVTDNNNVYLCLRAGINATTGAASGSTVNPESSPIDTAGVIDNRDSDGYIWKYMFTVDTNSATAFLTSAFCPVKHLTEEPTGGDSALANQWQVRSNATAGAIYNIVVENGGSGYDPASTTVTITGNGTGCTVAASDAIEVDSNGSIVNIKVDEDAYGSGYDYAIVEISGAGQDATARAVIGPKNGFGYDPREDLRAHYITINATLTGSEGGELAVNQDFRQIAIIKNPATGYDGNNDPIVATGDALSATKTLTIPTAETWIDYTTSDFRITGDDSGAEAIVVDYDSATGILRYIQTESTGFVEFTTADTIFEKGTTTNGAAVASVDDGDVLHYTGECVFLENRTAVSRSEDQIETIKLVIEL